MDKRKYLQNIESAPRLDRNLFNLSSEAKIDGLERLLDNYSGKYGETMVGVPLVQPYGGPICEYILLPEKQYEEMYSVLINKEITGIGCLGVGVSYNKRRLDKNRKNLKNNEKLSPGVIRFMEKMKIRAKKIEIHKSLVENYS